VCVYGVGKSYYFGVDLINYKQFRILISSINSG